MYEFEALLVTSSLPSSWLTPADLTAAAERVTPVVFKILSQVLELSTKDEELISRRLSLRTAIAIATKLKAPQAQTRLHKPPDYVNTAVSGLQADLSRSCTTWDQAFNTQFRENANSAIEFTEKFTGPLFMTAGSLFGHTIFGEVCAPWDDDIDLLTTVEGAVKIFRAQTITGKKALSVPVSGNLTSKLRQRFCKTKAMKQNHGRCSAFSVYALSGTPDTPLQCIVYMDISWGFIQVHFSRDCKQNWMKMFDLGHNGAANWRSPKGARQSGSATGNICGSSKPDDVAKCDAAWKEVSENPHRVLHLLVPLQPTTRAVVSGINLHIPNMASKLLDIQYGPGWNERAWLCPHWKATNFVECTLLSPPPLWDLRTVTMAGREVPECSNFFASRTSQR